MLRKILLLAVAALGALTASAQIGRRCEFGVAYGLAPTTDWVDTYSSPLLDLIAGADTSLSGWGSVTASFQLRLSGQFSLGAQAVYSSNEQRVRRSGSRFDTRYWSLLPCVKWNWLNLRIVSLYARAGAGATFARAKMGERRERSTDFAFQLSPLGVEVGGRIALYAEAGIGVSGCFLAGVRYRF